MLSLHSLFSKCGSTCQTLLDDNVRKRMVARQLVNFTGIVWALSVVINRCCLEIHVTVVLSKYVSSNGMPIPVWTDTSMTLNQNKTEQRDTQVGDFSTKQFSIGSFLHNVTDWRLLPKHDNYSATTRFKLGQHAGKHSFASGHWSSKFHDFWKFVFRVLRLWMQR